MLYPFVDVAEEPLDLFSAEALDGHDRAVLLELEARSGDDFVLEANASPQLYRALEEQRSARMDGRPGVPFYDDRRDPVVSKEQGARQSDETAADDENAHVLVRHREIFVDLLLIEHGGRQAVSSSASEPNGRVPIQDGVLAQAGSIPGSDGGERPGA